MLISSINFQSKELISKYPTKVTIYFFSTEDWTQSLAQARQALYHRATLPAQFLKYHYKLMHWSLCVSIHYCVILNDVQTVSIWPAAGSSPSWFLRPSTMCPASAHWLPCLLVSQEALGTPCVSPAPDLQTAISPKSPSSFSWEMVLGKNKLGLRKAHCSWVSTVSGPCQSTELEHFIFKC